MLNSVDDCYLLTDAALMAAEYFHFGQWLKRQVEATGRPSIEFCRRTGISESALYRWFREKVPGIQGYKMEKIAKALALPREELDAKLAAAAGSSDEIEDRNVEPYSEVSVEEIPTFELPIAAGVMTELPDAEEMHDPRLLRLKRFRVKIRGESMEKEYPDGSIIEFKCLEWRQDGTADKMETGKDYYVQSQDTATFKRLAEIHDGELVFAAVNKRKFPDKIRLLRDDITRMAKAVAVVRFVG